MAIERWGSLSVRDHLDLDSLITNILLYDRLVIPVPDGPTGQAEWDRHQWQPHRQKQILSQLGELAVTRKWDTLREENFIKLHRASRLEFDVQNMIKDPKYQITRMLLAQEETLDLPSGVAGATLVAGYNSEEECLTDMPIDPVDTARGRPNAEHLLAGIFHNEIILPAMDDPETALKQAIDLSLDKDYRGRRQDYYEWQRRMVADEVSPAVAVREMSSLIEDYNQLAVKALKKVRKKFAFTVGGVSLSLAGALLTGNPLPAVGALLSFAAYRNFDSLPNISRDRCQPAAMFHAAKANLSR